MKSNKRHQKEGKFVTSKEISAHQSFMHPFFTLPSSKIVLPWSITIAPPLKIL